MALSSFYRSEALEHAAQREPIDGLATVTVPYDWAALTVLAAACAAIAAWGVLGQVERTVRADALVFVPDERHIVVAPVDGRLTEVLVDPGDRVNAGEPLARVAIPELDLRLTVARERERLVLEELPRVAPEAGLRQMLIDVRAEAAALTAMIAHRAVIASPHAGEVIEHRLSPGAIVTAGEEVARIRTGPPVDPVAVASLPQASAADVQLGAPARLHCGGTGSEGLLETSVAEVSRHPATVWGLPADAGLGPGERHVRLSLPDSAAVAEGDRCEVFIVIDARAPLQFLLPATRPE